MPNVLMITVNYREADSTSQFLHSLSGSECFQRAQVIVVENGSGEGSPEKLRPLVAAFRNVELLESAANRGYFGAARFALDQYLAKGNALPDWLIVCNHDVLIDDKEFFSKLLRQDTRCVGVIAPRIQVLPGGVDQNPFMKRRPGPLRWAQLRLVSSNYSVALVWDWLWRKKSQFKSLLAARRTESLAGDRGSPESIYAAHGSFFIFSRRYFEAGGFLDGNLFLYGEEISVAETCRSLTLPIVYEPSLCVVHKEHQSTGKVLSRFTYECQKKALQYVTRRYLSPSGEPVGSCQPDPS